MIVGRSQQCTSSNVIFRAKSIEPELNVNVLEVWKGNAKIQYETLDDI